MAMMEGGQGSMVSTPELLDYASFMCARKIERFGDLKPMEVEALMRSLWRD